MFSYLSPSTECNWEVEQTPPYADLLAVGRVCRYWREVAISATELWTHIIFSVSCTVPVKEELSIAKLCMRRSGMQPLDFFYTTPFPGLLRAEDLIPDRRRLRSVVYGYVGDDFGGVDELAPYLLPASNLERLEIRGSDGLPLPTLFPDIVPHLRELTISRCTPWPNNQFGSLTSLRLLCQKGIDENVNPLVKILQCSPNLEELLLEGEFRSETDTQQTPKPNIPTVPLHSLKRLHICRLAAETTRHLLGALDLLPNGILMRFTNISTDLDAIFPETIAPKLSPRSATKLELIYPSKGGVILHATNGVVHTRLAYRQLPRRGEFLRWIAKKVHPLRELWLHIDRDTHYEMPTPLVLRDLETFVIEIDPNEKFNSVFLPMLSPYEDSAHLPHLSTLEIRNVFGVAKFGEALKARSDAGFHLKTLRIRWFEGCEARMAPLAQFVDNLEFYRVAEKTSRGLKLPEGCMVKSRWWGTWSRDFVGEMENEPVLWTDEVQ